MPEIPSKHTPGPWSVDSGDEFMVTADCDGGMICDTDNADRLDDDTAKANARLIAAAPELLDALRSVCEFFDTWQSERGPAEDALFEDINGAIAKATQ